VGKLAYGERPRPFDLGGLHTGGRQPSALTQLLDHAVEILVAGHGVIIAEHRYKILTRFGRDGAADVNWPTLSGALGTATSKLKIR
jgi:hypothetical protein